MVPAMSTRIVAAAAAWFWCDEPQNPSMCVIQYVCHGEIGTSISEPSKQVPIFLFATQGGEQASSYFRQGNWVQAREAQIRFPVS